MYSKFLNGMHFRPFIIFLLALNFLTPFGGQSQEKARIELEQGDRLIGENINGIDYKILIGDVVLIHDGTYFYCDSAVINNERNDFRAFGKVYVLMSDSVELYGDRLTYEGNTKVAHVYDNVRLIDKKTTLYTEYLIYYRLQKKGTYNQGGRIVDDENVLTSRIGEYYSTLNEYFFTDSVTVTTPEHVIKSDTLRYNTQSETVHFRGYSTLTSKDDFMFAYKGWSDTKNDITSLKNHAMVKHKHHIIYGDSVYFDKTQEYGYAEKDAVLMDTEKEMVVEGQTVEYILQESYAYATDSAFAVLIDNNDSLFLHADTLKMLFDSANKFDRLLAYDKTKFFRKDMQGACDLLIYNLKDSIISMYQEPVLWSGKNQLTSDSLKIFMTNNAIDSLSMYNSAFIVSEDSMNTYNQIKGRDVVAFFKRNEMDKIRVNGNSETIYYIRDENTKAIIGVNKALSSNMVITLENREMIEILYLDNPKATLYPITDITPEEQKLKGFKWLDYMRPKKKEDIFKNPAAILAPITETKPEKKSAKATEPKTENNKVNTKKQPINK